MVEINFSYFIHNKLLSFTYKPNYYFNKKNKNENIAQKENYNYNNFCFY